MFLQNNRMAAAQLEVIQPVKPAAVELANAIQNNSGVVDISDGHSVEIWSLPKSTTYSISNNAGHTEKAIKAFIFNEDVLNNTLTYQTITAGDEPTITYNDGFSGKLISQNCKSVRNGRGMRVKAITINGYVDGVASDAAIEALNLAIQGYNGINGTPIPTNYDLTEALRNTQFKDGMVTVKVDFFVNAVSQIVMDVPISNSYTFNIVWDYSDLK